MQIAIIGTGIAGMGCAHRLFKTHDITVFEQADYIGGHTNTAYVNEDGQQIPIDTGFIVFNNENYPHLNKLFAEINAPFKKTSMSFAAHIVHENIAYCGSSLKLLFAQKKNIFSPRYIRFLVQLNKFNAVCLEVLDNKELQTLSIAEYVSLKGWGKDLLNWYLLPMSSALWSTPPDTSAQFPALSLVRFFKNHGFLGLNTQFQWYTVDGGSEEYKKRLIAPFKDRIQVNSKITGLRRLADKIELTNSNGQQFLFDKVIIATHGNQALELLSDASDKEKQLLLPFQYQLNKATLHTDASIMPNVRSVWSSWNYRTEIVKNELVASCTYWMNSLQDVSKKKNYFVTINDPGCIDKQHIIKEIMYEHPVFTVEAMQAQARLPELNQNGRLYFCGSYFRYGFHEDALMSANQVCDIILNTA
jgi:uncharacterized protein